MPGPLDGLIVLDLSTGIAGPIATMLLADHGARVTRIERPGDEPSRRLSGARVWHRGKRSAVLDLRDPGDLATFRSLAARADVVVESFRPGTAARLGVDHVTLRAGNPSLVHCSITAYGTDGPDAARPGYDALVGARTGALHDLRGRAGGAIGLLSGTAGMLPGIEAPPGCEVGPDRDGPLFPGVPWASVATAYLANLAINAALRARCVTGAGQHVRTSLLQGVLATTIAGWQRVERPDHAGFETWVVDPRAPKGFFRAADGRWTHHWVPLPAFVLGASAGDHLEVTDEVTSPKEAPARIGTAPEEMVVLHHYTPLLAEAVARFPADEWVDFAARVGVPVQPVRSPEEALLDPLLVADGCVTELDDADVGTIRAVGRVLSLGACPVLPPRAGAPRLGAHTDEVRAEAATAPVRSGADATAGRAALRSPLEGVLVLDLGLAVAGPFGTQLLSDLGADVIKVNTHVDRWWMTNHIAMCCNRGKRSITIDLKEPRGLAVLHRLVERADVVHHNMRYDAAIRLGVDFESLRARNAGLVYCHTRGHERGPREALPGNDQTGAALAGTEWLDGGLDDGGRPLWALGSLGDTGNGFLSAIGVVQALAHRDRTGEGQFVDTAILYAQLLNASTAWVTADGATAGDRQRLDRDALGWHPRYRLYRCADGEWLCIAAVTDAHAAALAAVTGCASLDGASLEGAFSSRAAPEWFATLDAAGVPCEVVDAGWVHRAFDDPLLRERGWVTSYTHPHIGRMDVFGLLFDLDGTPGRIAGPPVVPGQHTREILGELGVEEDEIQELLADGVVDAVDV